MRNSLLWSSFAFALLACSHHSKPQVATAGPPLTETPSTSKCAVMQPPGTNVVTSDTNDGVAIVFTTTGDVSDLRAQLRQIADHHNEMVGAPSGQGVSPGSPDTHGATIGGDVRGSVGDHSATAGADVHGDVKNKDDTHGATVGGDVHAGTKDKTATVGGDVHAGVKDNTAKVGGDLHAGIKDKDRNKDQDSSRDATVGADVHGGVNDRTATVGGDVHGGMTSTGQGDMQMIPARARVEDIPGGERLVLVPEDPSQLPALREQARQQVSMLEKGECPRLITEPQLQPTGDNPNRHPTGT